MCKEKIQELEEELKVARHYKNRGLMEKLEEDLTRIRRYVQERELRRQPRNWVDAFQPDKPFFPGLVWDYDTPVLSALRWGMLKDYYMVGGKERVEINTDSDAMQYFNHMARTGKGITPFNARIESLVEWNDADFFRNNRRCVIFAPGHYEYHTVPQAKGSAKKYPFVIRRKDRCLSMFGGVYRHFEEASSGEEYLTYKLITVPANRMMGLLHNQTQSGDLRMPLQFKDLEDAIEFLQPIESKADKDELLTLATPLPDGELKIEKTEKGLFISDEYLEAWTVEKLGGKYGNANTSTTLEPFLYDELEITA